MTTPTRSRFIVHYRALLYERHEWTRDMNKFLPFMENVRLTINGQDTGWLPDSRDALDAWYAIGMKSDQPTITKLRALLE